MRDTRNAAGRSNEAIRADLAWLDENVPGHIIPPDGMQRRLCDLALDVGPLLDEIERLRARLRSVGAKRAAWCDLVNMGPLDASWFIRSLDDALIGPVAAARGEAETE